MRRFWRLSAFVMALVFCPALAVVIHVPRDYPAIQQGIDAATSGDIVLVAPGHYPEEILLKSGVTVQGAGEGQSIIDGGGNSGDVVQAIGNSIRGDTKFQGFTVTGAISGGGLPGGAGLFCNSGASPDVNNNRFEGNDFGIATWNGGNPVIRNNVVCHNNFFGVDISSNPTVINNTIAFNIIGIDDGGGYGPVVMNNIVTNNSRHGVYAVGTQPQLTYNDVWGNDTNYRNCSPGSGCISADPLYADSATRDYHLKPGSPCIDAGNPASQYNDPDNTRNDIGTYGGPGAPSGQPEVTTLVPAPNELDVELDIDLAAGFNVPITPGSINAATFQVCGLLSGPHPGTISYDSAARLATLDPAQDFVVGEPVTAILTHDITSSSGDTFPGFSWQFFAQATGGSGRFSTLETLLTSDSLNRVACADVNLDGNLDLAVIGSWTHDVSIFLGDGDGAFQPALHNSLPGLPNAFVVADFNSDSIPDLAATLENDSIVVLLGQGDGYFRAPVTYPCPGRPWGTACADLNLDGEADLAVTCRSGSQIAVLLGHGDGTFDAPAEFATGSTPDELCAADLNRDGIPDLVNANMASNNISVFLGKGDGTFDSLGHFPAGTGPCGIRLGDLNEDGILDAAVTDPPGNTVTILTGTGTGAFTNSGSYPVSGLPREPCVADLNADGALDIAVANRETAYLAVLLGRGDGTFQNAVYWPTPSGPLSVAAADFDNDGDLDIATGSFSSNQLGILFNDNGLEIESFAPARFATQVPANAGVSAVFSQPLDPATLDSSSFSVYGALTGLHRGAIVWDSATCTASLDPRQDFATGEFVTAEFTNRIAARSGPRLAGFAWPFAAAIGTGSSGVFGAATGYPAGTEPRGLCVADFDQDHDIDIVTTTNSPSAIAVIKNNGDGTFAAPVLANVGGDPIAVFARDLDSDGDIDLAVFHNEPGTSHLEILKNMGTGNFTLYSVYAPAVLGQDISGGDFDADGDIDLVLTDGWGSSNNVHVMFNNGSGSFTGPVNYSAGSGTRGVTTSDVNNDGALDIIAANSGNNSVSVLLNDGTGGFGSPADYPTATAPNAVYAWDFNGDGWADLATTHPGLALVAVLLNHGDGTFAASTSQYCDLGQNYLTGGDFDGDGDIDLAASGYNADSCVVLLNNGDGCFPTDARYQVGATPWGIGCADFNLDGALDLAVANYGNGNVSILPAIDLGITGPGNPLTRTAFAAYPSPFSDRLVILIPGSPTPAPCALVSVFDASGRLVRTLPVPQSLTPVSRPLTWDGLDNSGRAVNPGIYFVSLSSNRQSSLAIRHSLKVILTR